MIQPQNKLTVSKSHDHLADKRRYDVALVDIEQCPTEEIESFIWIASGWTKHQALKNAEKKLETLLARLKERMAPALKK